MRIIDCFPYNGESIALYRLSYLWDIVDEFIIVEAAETHAGEKKDYLYLNKYAQLLAPFNEKITRLVIESFPQPNADELANLANRSYVQNPRVWFRECYQRNFARGHLTRISSQMPWILMACDVDEIPRYEVVEKLPNYYDFFVDPHKLEMLMFYYSSEWIKDNKWYGSYVVNNQGIAKYTLDDMRTDQKFKKFINDAGWHLSYFMTDEEIQRKIKSFAHTEYNTEQLRALEWIRECKRTGMDLYNRGAQTDCAQYLGNNLPKGLREFERAHGIRD